jgi:hypothetical protein
MKQVSHAVETFSKDISAKFDFMDISCKDNFVDSSNSYLALLFVHYRTRFHQAIKMLSDRFLDSFYHHLQRTGTKISPMQIQRVQQERLVKLDQDIRPFIPCSATKKFDGIEEPVQCESLQSNHGDVHQSSQTYKKKAFIIAEISAPCRWEGKMEGYPVGWFVDPDILKSPPLTGVDFFKNHKRVLESQNQMLSIYHDNARSTLMCLGCILGPCTELLDCDHGLCTQCCEEFLVDGLVECPFCNNKSKWKHEDIPPGAGIRVLTVCGNGVQGMSAAVLLQQIEERLGTNIHHLFDMVSGTNTGALSALGFGILHMAGERVVNLFQQASKSIQTAEKPKNEKHKYDQAFKIANSLKQFIPNKAMFVGSQMPRVVVTVPDQDNSEIARSYDAKQSWFTELSQLAGRACLPAHQSNSHTAMAQLACKELWGESRLGTFDIILDIGLP